MGKMLNETNIQRIRERLWENTQAPMVAASRQRGPLTEPSVKALGSSGGDPHLANPRDNVARRLAPEGRAQTVAHNDLRRMGPQKRSKLRSHVMHINPALLPKRGPVHCKVSLGPTHKGPEQKAGSQRHAPSEREVLGSHMSSGLADPHNVPEVSPLSPTMWAGHALDVPRFE